MAQAADRRSMSSSERLVVLGGLGLGVASLVPWYQPGELSFGPDAVRTNGWQEPDAILSQLGTIGGVLLAVVVMVAARQPERPVAGTVSWGTLLTSGSAVVFGLIALKFSLNTDGTTVGVYLALAAAATQLYGAYVTRLEEPPVVASEVPTSFRPPLSPPPPSVPGVAGRAPPPLNGSPAPTDHQAPSAFTAGSSPHALHAEWPETSYFLTTWLRPDTDVEVSTAAYRLAFAHDPARQARLAMELGALLDPSRPGAERDGFVAALAPHTTRLGGSVLLQRLMQALVNPPGS
jgi:hypothetical protein